MPKQPPQAKVKIYLEVGTKRAFAGALDWPGWCRSGKDVDSAVMALLEAAPRYARVMKHAVIDFRLPKDVEELVVMERLPGSGATDFGAPEAIPVADEAPLDEPGVQTRQAILRACWHALDQSASAAANKELRKGPRGGGRDLEDILIHVQQAEVGYLSRVGKKVETAADLAFSDLQKLTRDCVLVGLEYANGPDYPSSGPRGGKRWPAGYFVRRVAWHVLDHAWEIEDRS